MYFSQLQSLLNFLKIKKNLKNWKCRTTRLKVTTLLACDSKKIDLICFKTGRESLKEILILLTLKEKKPVIKWNRDNLM